MCICFPDGSEAYKGRRHRLPLNVTEVGAERGMSVSGQYLQLYGPDIHPRHCVVAHTEGIVTVTPTSNEAETYVENQRIYETTMLQHDMVVRFGKGFIFRFIDPLFEEVSHQNLNIIVTHVNIKLGFSHCSVLNNNIHNNNLRIA